jgi:hypothetical protein
MPWEIVFDEQFDPEFEALPTEVQDELYAQTEWIKQFGPQMGRPRVDTLKGSAYPNMKELRFNADDGVWRVAFAFDPTRRAILLVAGDKSGLGQRNFYKTLIAKADSRYKRHLASLPDSGVRITGQKGNER